MPELYPSQPNMLSLRTSYSDINLPSKQPPVPQSTIGISMRTLNTSFQTPPDFLTEAKLGIVTQSPELCADGTGGTYFLKNVQNKTVAVFKPQDEDPLSKLNPKRTETEAPLHFEGIQAGEGSLREVLAYQVDPEFFAVPETYWAEVCHVAFNDGHSKSNIKRKLGSLQRFVPAMSTAEDVGSSLFSVEDVQKIAILDILLVNCDRNGGNILVHPETHRLVPIDHSFSLPDYFHVRDLRWFEWMNYRQSRQPLAKAVEKFLKELDIQSWVEKASALKIREECIVTMEMAHVFLTKALSCGKNLHEIGRLMCSPNPRVPSVFANLVADAASKSSSSKDVLDYFVMLVHSHFSC